MSFLNATAAEIASHVSAVIKEAAGIVVVVRVGEEGAEHRNIAVDLPRAKTKRDGFLLRNSVAAAMEKARVTLAQHALAPRVLGSITGNVRVRPGVRAGSCGDASHLCQGPKAASGVGERESKM